MTYAYPLDGSEAGLPGRKGPPPCLLAEGNTAMTDIELSSETNEEPPPGRTSLDEWDGDPWDDNPVDPSAVGPQCVFLRAEDVDQNASAATPVTPLREDEEFSSPEERAEERFNRLSAAFSATLVIVAQMYRDEDWRYLRKDDGSEYTSLVEVVQVAMGKSLSMARRYVQGARDFYLPLSAVMVDGTRLEITSSDIANLGSEGIRSVVDEATERLHGVDDPDEATEIVTDTLKGAREERQRGREEQESSSGREENGGREFHESPAADAFGPVETYTGDEDEWPSDSPVSDSGSAGPESHFSADEDLIAPLLAGAPLFREDADLDSLPIAVKRVVRAMLVIEDADVKSIAQALSFENRGIISHVDSAQKSLTRIRSVAEAQPWVLKHLEGGN